MIFLPEAASAYEFKLESQTVQVPSGKGRPWDTGRPAAGTVTAGQATLRVRVRLGSGGDSDDHHAASLSHGTRMTQIFRGS